MEHQFPSFNIQMIPFNIYHLHLCLKIHQQEETSFHPHIQTSNQLEGERENHCEFKSSSYEFPSQHNVTSETSVWIQKLQGPAGSVKERISFAAFHSKITTAISAKSVSQLLPLPPDSVNTPATVRHCALVIKKHYRENDSWSNSSHHSWSTCLCATKTSPMEVSRGIRKSNLDDGTYSYWDADCQYDWRLVSW